MVTGFLTGNPTPIPQNGEQTGQFYQRSGGCNQCGKCCTNIYLVYNKTTVQTLEQFERLKQFEPEYQYFTPLNETEHGVRFRCRHLQANNACAIYQERPDFCKQYPSEAGIMLGAELAEGCGYAFEAIKKFKAVMAETNETGLSKEYTIDQRPLDDPAE